MHAYVSARALGLIFSIALLVACDAESERSSDGSVPDGSLGGADTGPVDAGSSDAAAADAGPVGPEDAGAADAAASSNLDCTFNADCPSHERCECDELAGCFCRIGVRGQGQKGVDTCVDSNDCETALCLEGPADQLYCSGPCNDDGDCTSILPICSNIAFVGPVCIRMPGS